MRTVDPKGTALKVITRGKPPRSDTYGGTLRRAVTNASMGVHELRFCPAPWW
jgi:hypothetical protein